MDGASRGNRWCIRLDHDAEMTDRQAGRLVEAVRRHLGLRQIDVARMADVDQKTVSVIETGQLERVSQTRFRRVCAALGIESEVLLRWRGGLGDRLIDRGHAAIVEVAIGELERRGWQVVPEFSFNVYGERGSVDVLAWHPIRRALLIVEVKTLVTDIQALLMSMSRKLRLVPPLVAEDRGWHRDAFGRLLVVAATRANRTTIASHAATFDAVFPGSSRESRRWLREPVGDFAGLWFVAIRTDSPAKRVIRTRVPASHARTAPATRADQDLGS
jgi:transcriptional regulator with XRE-family HTH domain